MTGLDLLKIPDFVAADQRKHRTERTGKVTVLNVDRTTSNRTLDSDQFCYIARVLYRDIEHTVL